MYNFERLQGLESFALSIPAIDETYVGEIKPFRIDLALTIPSESAEEVVQALKSKLATNAFEFWQELTESGVYIRARFSDHAMANQSYVDIMLLLDPNFAAKFTSTLPVDPVEEITG
jgi:hypothetical protein